MTRIMGLLRQERTGRDEAEAARGHLMNPLGVEVCARAVSV